MEAATTTTITADAPDIDDRLRHAAQHHPENIAVKIGGESLTWQAFDARISKVANTLRQRGLGAGDRVAALSRNSLAYVELVFGVLRAGGCITPLQTLASPQDLVGIVNDSGAKFLFVSSEYLHGMLEQRDHLKTLIDGGLITFDSCSEQVEEYETVIAEASPIAPNLILPSSLGACLVYSSGTTGMPKGILQNRQHKARECADMQGVGLSPNTRTLISTPMCSSTTLFILIAALGHGGMVVMMKKFDAASFLALSEQERVTHAILVPVQYERILTCPDFGETDMSSYECKISIGAPLRKEVKLDILDRWPAGGLLEFYGMTEGGPGCVLVAHERRDKLDSVGQPPENCDLKILDEQGNVLPHGEIGEVVGWSPKMMVGYWKQDQATADIGWCDEVGKRFHRSGDMGWLDAEGYLHLVDRKKDMIISGGFNIYAADLERILLQHDDIHEAAVVGAPSKQWGETPVGFVTVHPDTVVDVASVRDWANSQLGKVQRLAAIYVINELPRNPIGKILKRELRKQAPEQP